MREKEGAINSKLEHNRTPTLKIGNYHFALAYTTLLLLLDHSKIFHNFFSQIPGFQRKNVSIFEKFSFHLKAYNFRGPYNRMYLAAFSLFSRLPRYKTTDMQKLI